MRVTVGDINEDVSLVELNENALTFGSRARGRHRCDMVLSLSTALALDAQSRRRTSTVGQLLLAVAPTVTEVGFFTEDEKRQASSAQRAALSFRVTIVAARERRYLERRWIRRCASAVERPPPPSLPGITRWRRAKTTKWSRERAGWCVGKRWERRFQRMHNLGEGRNRRAVRERQETLIHAQSSRTAGLSKHENSIALSND